MKAAHAENAAKADMAFFDLSVIRGKCEFSGRNDGGTFFRHGEFSSLGPDRHGAPVDNFKIKKTCFPMMNPVVFRPESMTDEPDPEKGCYIVHGFPVAGVSRQKRSNFSIYRVISRHLSRLAASIRFFLYVLRAIIYILHCFSYCFKCRDEL